MGAHAEDGHRRQLSKTAATAAVVRKISSSPTSTSRRTRGVPLHRPDNYAEQSLSGLSRGVLRNRSRPGRGVRSDVSNEWSQCQTRSLRRGSPCDDAPAAVLGDSRFANRLRLSVRSVGGVDLSHHRRKRQRVRGGGAMLGSSMRYRCHVRHPRCSRSGGMGSTAPSGASGVGALPFYVADRWILSLSAKCTVQPAENAWQNESATHVDALLRSIP